MANKVLEVVLLSLLHLCVPHLCERGSHQQGGFGGKKSYAHGHGRSMGIGPSEEHQDRFSYMCSIRKRGSRDFVCSAFLIGPEWVVTAASCVDPNVIPFGLLPIVYCGVYSEDDVDKERVFNGEGVIHPNWTGDYTKGFDIAAVKLDHKTKLTPPFVNKCPFPLPAETRLTTVGWSKERSDKSSTDLRISRGHSSIERAACRKMVSFEVEDHMICISQDRNSTFQGLAGGPLLIPDRGDSIEDGIPSLDLVIGVASGHVQSDTNNTAIYTSVGHFWEWIEHVIEGKQRTCKAANETEHHVHLTSTIKTPSTEAHVPAVPSPDQKASKKHEPPKTSKKIEHSPKPVAPTKTKPWGSRYAGLSGEDLDAVLKTVVANIKNDKAWAVGQFLGEGLDPDSVYGSDGYTLLHWAAEYCSPNCIEVLLEFGAYVDHKTNERTPLHTAAEKGCLSAAEVLLTHGADIEARGIYQSTPLLGACMEEKWNVAGFLIDKGANVQARNKWRMTSLHFASWLGGDDVVKLLLSKGTEVDARNIDGKTPLWLACDSTICYRNVQIVKDLLDAGASKTAKANDGKRPYDVICTCSDGCTDAIKQLKDLLRPTSRSFEE